MLLFGCYLLSENPPILSTVDNFVATYVKNVPVEVVAPTVFVFHSWAVESPRELFGLYRKVRNPGRSRLVHMCNVPSEKRRLRWLGYEAEVCHQNLFCDESTLRIVPVSKQFDAIYVAQVKPFKRVHLASGVERLRMVAANCPVDPSLLESLGVSKAMINDRYYDREELAEAISSARCGLALSAVEGGMLAATEILLCGVPIVSTSSRGGRDVWFTGRNSIMCPATVAGVTAAVGDAMKRDWDAEQIRTDAIARCREHRQILADFVQRYGGRPRFDPAAITGRWFRENFLQIYFLKEFLQSWNGSGFTRMDLLGRVATNEEAAKFNSAAA
jgi:glycosyltransferase involved in cell wall biosynthesis